MKDSIQRGEIAEVLWIKTKIDDPYSQFTLALNRLEKDFLWDEFARIDNPVWIRIYRLREMKEIRQ